MTKLQMGILAAVTTALASVGPGAIRAAWADGNTEANPGKDAPKRRLNSCSHSAAILCRGPLEVLSGDLSGKPTNLNIVDSLVLTFRKAKGAAGLYGEKLKPGECSWPDRPFRSDEIFDVLRVNWSTAYSRWSADWNKGPSVRVKEMVFAKCITSDKCVYRNCVGTLYSKSYTDAWDVTFGVGEVLYPFADAASKSCDSSTGTK